MPNYKAKPEPKAGRVWHRNEPVPEEDNRNWIWPMQVMINFAASAEFQQLYLDYLGRRPESIKTFAMALAPGQADTMWVYRVPDNTALATWIQLRHPDWIDTSGSWV
jgi:hypothetical protein